MNKTILITACILGITAIILGAFGAHGLKAVLPEKSIETFEVGVRYQIYHALFLLFLGSLSIISEDAKTYIFYTALIGTVLFSGSIYLLATNTLTSINFKILGPVTPIGGLFLIVSWVLLLVQVFKIK